MPLSMSARSHTAISVARRLNSFTCVSKSDDHLLTISSIVFPLIIDGGGTEMAADGVVPEGAVVVDAPASIVRCHNP